MKMAREFGIKSYKPEDVSFVKSGMDGTDGSPWNKLKTKLAKNILLEAYHNPSTIEELSLELGVAAPYMEEAVDELVEATLMVKLDNNKYKTDFSKSARLNSKTANISAKWRFAKNMKIY